MRRELRGSGKDGSRIGCGCIEDSPTRQGVLPLTAREVLSSMGGLNRAACMDGYVFGSVFMWTGRGGVLACCEMFMAGRDGVHWVRGRQSSAQTTQAT